MRERSRNRVDLDPLHGYNEVRNSRKEKEMTHNDEGDYAGKHGGRVALTRVLTEAIKKRSSEGRMSCEDAFGIASELNVKPSEVGKGLDLLEIKIVKCQLGLFGYEKETRLIVQAAEAVPLDLERTLKELLVNGRLSCATAWNIAKRFKRPKMDITAACENLKLRIAHCQLGAF
jgi:hypothetical protein